MNWIIFGEVSTSVDFAGRCPSTDSEYMFYCIFCLFFGIFEGFETEL